MEDTALMFLGRGGTQAAAYEAALAEYTAWLDAQTGGGPGGTPAPTIWFNDQGEPLVILQPTPIFNQLPPLGVWECALGAVAQMRIPVRMVGVGYTNER